MTVLVYKVIRHIRDAISALETSVQQDLLWCPRFGANERYDFSSNHQGVLINLQGAIYKMAAPQMTVIMQTFSMALYRSMVTSWQVIAGDLT